MKHRKATCMPSVLVAAALLFAPALHAVSGR